MSGFYYKIEHKEWILLQHRVNFVVEFCQTLSPGTEFPEDLEFPFSKERLEHLGAVGDVRNEI